MTEYWRPVVGYEGLYMVSNLGRVKSLNYKNTGKEHELSPVLIGGYKRVLLYKNRNRKHYLVHRLVAMAFLPNPNNLPEVNHKDEDKFNNCVDNLEWCTRKYNNNYGTGIERRVMKRINGKDSKVIYQYSLNGDLIKVWPSSKEIQRQTGYDRSFICSCCRCKDKNRTAYGFKWRYHSLLV